MSRGFLAALFKFAARQDTLRPQAEQPVVLTGLAGTGDHLIAQLCQQGHRNTAYPATGAGHQHRAGITGQPGLFQFFHAQTGRQPRGAEQHGFAQTQPGGTLDHPGSRDANVLGHTAAGVHAQIVSGDDHFVASCEFSHG